MQNKNVDITNMSLTVLNNEILLNKVIIHNLQIHEKKNPILKENNCIAYLKKGIKNESKQRHLSPL